jgi:hypothetical protein
MDPEAPQWDAFLTALGALWGERPFTVSELVERLLTKKAAGLREALPDRLVQALDGGEGNFRQQLGKAFQKQADIRYGDAGIYLTRAGKNAKKNVTQRTIW